MDLGNFVQEMIVLYLIGLAGFFGRKKGILGKETNQVLTQLILYITLPSLILYTLDIPFSITAIEEFVWLAAMSIYIIVIASLIGIMMRRKSGLQGNKGVVYESLIIFGNQGFIGYAVSYMLFQEQGVIYLTMFNVCYLIHIWAYGIYLFTRNAQGIPWRKIWFNPGIVSTLIGFIIFITPLTWPVFIASGFESIGKTTIPLSMIVIGSLVANVKVKDLPQLLKNRLLWKAAFARLILIPICLLPFIALPIPFTLLVIAVLVTGMPAAPTTSLYAQKFGGDTLSASLGTLLTTILCIGSLPLLYALSQFLYELK